MKYICFNITPKILSKQKTKRVYSFTNIFKRRIFFFQIKYRNFIETRSTNFVKVICYVVQTIFYNYEIKFYFRVIILCVLLFVCNYNYRNVTFFVRGNINTSIFCIIVCCSSNYYLHDFIYHERNGIFKY